jgi:hypothetical protein
VEPWTCGASDRRRACRDRLSRSDGGLLQTAPLLIRDGRNVIAATGDPEGFAATCAESIRTSPLTGTRGWRSL